MDLARVLRDLSLSLLAFNALWCDVSSPQFQIFPDVFSFCFNHLHNLSFSYSRHRFSSTQRNAVDSYFKGSCHQASLMSSSPTSQIPFLFLQTIDTSNSISIFAKFGNITTVQLFTGSSRVRGSKSSTELAGTILPTHLHLQALQSSIITQNNQAWLP